MNTIVSSCSAQEHDGTGVLNVVGMWNILIGESKMKAWIVISDYEYPLEYAYDPWKEKFDGSVLVDSYPNCFSVFGKEKDAKDALRNTKKYAKNQKLYDIWDVKKWKIVEIDFPYSVLR